MNIGLCIVCSHYSVQYVLYSSVNETTWNTKKTNIFTDLARTKKIGTDLARTDNQDLDLVHHEAVH